MKRLLIGAALAAAVGSSCAQSAVPHRADVVACMSLRETDETRAGNLPPMRAEPRAGAPVVGLIGGVVFVPQPRQDRDGYTLVVRHDWVEGWVQSAWLQPFRVVSDPRATCKPRMNPDGTLSWGPAR